MKVVVLVVGRVKGKLEDAVAEYEKRAGRYWKLDVIEVAAGARGSREREAVLEAEAQRLLARLEPELVTVALTRDGKGLGSRELARFLQDEALQGSPGVTFVIGGAWGLSEGVRKRARLRLSLSSMTLPHEMARLLLAEQLYRAGTIGRGEPYHKGP